ncbi:hypothetical protein N341_10777, partial [Tyto alba]
FNTIATNFTDLKTRLVRRSKNYFEARLKLKRKLPRPFIHPILWGLLLGRITAKLFEDPPRKQCSHAGKRTSRHYLYTWKQRQHTICLESF